jgi:DNA-binding HxlR family transcriptional regulator
MSMAGFVTSGSLDPPNRLRARESHPELVNERSRWTAEQVLEIGRLDLELATPKAQVGVGVGVGDDRGVLLGKSGTDEHLDEQRWSELRRRAQGISEKMLAQTLKTLEADGLVHRDQQLVMPPRVDYSLTPLGEELAEVMVPLLRWVGHNADSIIENVAERKHSTSNLS